MTWQTGMMLVFGLWIVLWAAAAGLTYLRKLDREYTRREITRYEDRVATRKRRLDRQAYRRRIGMRE